jgi:hypothetical protein
VSFDPLEDDPFTSDPELEMMAREFRNTLREEQEEIEAITAEAFEAEVDMAFSFLEMMWSGSRVRVSIGEMNFEGLVTHVGKNLVQINTTPGTFADIQIPSITSVLVLDRESVGRSSYAKDPKTFVARMRELAAMPMQEVEIGSLAGKHDIVGILRLVRNDHIVVENREKKQWLVPLASVGFCLTRAKTR